MAKSFKTKMIRHPVLLGSVFTAIVVAFIFAMTSVVITFKAQGEQSDSRRILLQVYRSLYGYKTENGEFPNTAGKAKEFTELLELRPYVRSTEQWDGIENVNLSITSEEGHFIILLQKKLANGSIDIQVLNSKKQFCHQHDGIKNQSQNCFTSLMSASVG
ncbi:MAG: hypothetical protein V4591_09860 [Bdellovibrionota bacterium]